MRSPSFSSNLASSRKGQEPSIDLSDRELNRGATRVLSEMMSRAEELSLRISKSGGATLVDAFEASTEAALLGVRVSLGDVGTVAILYRQIRDVAIPYIAIDIQNPVVPSLASQSPGPELLLSTGKVVRCSGPARVFSKERDPIFSKIPYQEINHSNELIVLLASTSEPLSELECGEVSDKLGISADRLLIVQFSPNSEFGRINAAGRSLEITLRALLNYGDSLGGGIAHSYATAPVAPSISGVIDAQTHNRAMSLSIDAIRYGGEVTISTLDRETYQRLANVCNRVPSYTIRSNFARPAYDILGQMEIDQSKARNLLSVRSLTVRDGTAGQDYGPSVSVTREPLCEHEQVADAGLMETLSGYFSK